VKLLSKLLGNRGGAADKPAEDDPAAFNAAMEAIDRAAKARQQAAETAERRVAADDRRKSSGEPPPAERRSGQDRRGSTAGFGRRGI